MVNTFTNLILKTQMFIKKFQILNPGFESETPKLEF